VTAAIGVDARVTGAARYSVDVERPGMLHAAFVRSPYAHARVRSVDVSAVPGGCVALAPADVADLGRYGCQARDQRVLADVARYAGDVVAAVAAPTRAEARAAAGLVAVEYEELPAVFDVEAALQPGAPLLHEGPRILQSRRPDILARQPGFEGSNVIHLFTQRKGDAEAAFAKADLIVENTFYSPPVVHVERLQIDGIGDADAA